MIVIIGGKVGCEFLFRGGEKSWERKRRGEGELDLIAASGGLERLRILPHCQDGDAGPVARSVPGAAGVGKRKTIWFQHVADEENW